MTYGILICRSLLSVFVPLQTLLTVKKAQINKNKPDYPIGNRTDRNLRANTFAQILICKIKFYSGVTILCDRMKDSSVVDNASTRRNLFYYEN